MADIVISPFSNSDVRDWQPERYAELAGLLAERWTTGRIRITGTRNQRIAGRNVVRAAAADQVINECGRLTWHDLIAAVRSAACVIGNNSGICHLAGRLGVPTVCVFGGSHQRLEWRPLGPNVIVVTRALGCSPCHLDHSAVSFYDKACLRQIDAPTVMEAVFKVIDRDSRRPASHGSIKDVAA